MSAFSLQGTRLSSPLSWSSAFPPVVRRLLLDDRRCHLRWEVVAELPQFLGRARVLEQSPIDVERIQLAGAVAVNCVPDTGDEFTQLRVVVLRDHRARRPPLRLAGHDPRLYTAGANPTAQANREGASALR